MALSPPRVFISYSHDSAEHKELVLRFAQRLREGGVDAQLDQYVEGSPAEGWPRWMHSQLDQADFALLICTETYYRRFLGQQEPGTGKGVDWEGQLVTNAIYHGRGHSKRFVPVFFDRQEEQFIPEPLSGHTHYLLSSEDNYAKLYDFLTGQAGVVPGKLGPLKTRAREAVEPIRFWNAEAVGKLHGVPELPPHYLPREESLVELKQKLLSADASFAIAGITKPVVLTAAGKFGVQGMGGIGKTVLTAALAHDSEVRQAFLDGIYWLTAEYTEILQLAPGSTP